MEQMASPLSPVKEIVKKEISNKPIEKKKRKRRSKKTILRIKRRKNFAKRTKELVQKVKVFAKKAIQYIKIYVFILAPVISIMYFGAYSFLYTLFVNTDVIKNFIYSNTFDIVSHSVSILVVYTFVKLLIKFVRKNGSMIYTHANKFKNLDDKELKKVVLKI